MGYEYVSCGKKVTFALDDITIKHQKSGTRRGMGIFPVHSFCCVR